MMESEFDIVAGVVREASERRKEPEGLMDRWKKLKKIKGWEDKEDGGQ